MNLILIIIHRFAVVMSYPYKSACFQFECVRTDVRSCGGMLGRLSQCPIVGGIGLVIEKCFHRLLAKPFACGPAHFSCRFQPFLIKQKTTPNHFGTTFQAE